MSGRFHRYLTLVEPGKRILWAGMVVFALVISGLEGAGAVLVYALVGLATDPQGATDLPLVGDVRALLPDTPHDQRVALTAMAVAVFFVIRGGAVLGQRYYQDRVTQQAGVDLQTRLLERYLRLPYSFHLRRNSSELIRNTNESVAEILNSVLVPAVKLLSEAFVVLVILIVLMLALRVVRPRVRHLGSVSQREGARSYQALQQGLHGYRDITVLGRQDFFIDTFRRSRAVIARTRYLRGVLSELPRVSIEGTMIGLIAAFVAVSTLRGDGARESLAVLGLFAYAALRIMPALNKIVNSINAMRFGHAALDDVRDDLGLSVPEGHRGDERLPFSDALRLESVEFTYEGTSEPTLRDIDFEIRSGDSIGIVGATGSGKSTLVDLIVGLSHPTRGRITVDGLPLARRETAWQRNIGMVSQQVFLLDDTLRRNIALGVPQEEVDEDRVREAVRLAQLSEFVAALPEGLDTTVGEHGMRVSGGQRQRVAIARALYPQPSLIVLDEGTSALDNLTESMFIEALRELRRDHTIITVAHRLSTVRDYDRIVFMRAGRIEDIGTFDQLGARNEGFRLLAGWSGAPSA
jgi:ABC-type multidrug transport system fused ATPase/permease subunit